MINFYIVRLKIIIVIFTGKDLFQNKQPFDHSQFPYFRKILQESGLEFHFYQTF